MQQETTQADSGRDVRAYIAAAAKRIDELSRTSGESLDDSLEWDSIARLPRWCMTAQSEIHSLQKICGALALLNDVQVSTDGQALVAMNRFLGDTLFKHLLYDEPNELPSAAVPLPKTWALNFMTAGSSVLLSTLPETPLARLFFSFVGPPSCAMTQEDANTIYFRAWDLNQWLMASESLTTSTIKNHSSDSSNRSNDAKRHELEY